MESTLVKQHDFVMLKIVSFLLFLVNGKPIEMSSICSISAAILFNTFANFSSNTITMSAHPSRLDDYLGSYLVT